MSSKNAALSAGYVVKTVDVPANVIFDPELELSKTVSLLKVVPL